MPVRHHPARSQTPVWQFTLIVVNRAPAPGPVATNKWLTASVLKAPAAVIKRVFEEAERRDPRHRRRWVALVDGANHQIQRINFEAKLRSVKVTIIVDFVHVLHKLCLHCTLTFLCWSRGLASTVVSV